MKPACGVPKRVTEPSLLKDALLIAASLVMAFAVVMVISLQAEADYQAASLESGSRQ
jgi:hypothetical protein